MRTQEEIVQRFRERQPHDMFGFEIGEYLLALDREHLEQLRDCLKPDVDFANWTPTLDGDDKLRAVATGYMHFAWEKANNERGLSAWRSMAHYQAWLWMLGDDVIWPTLENYTHYGKEQLRTICAYLGLSADQWDDGRRVER